VRPAEIDPLRATLNIVDDDRPGEISLSSNTYSGNEGGSVTVTILRRPVGGAPLGGNVSVSYTVSDGSATAGLDYTSNASGIVTFVGAQTMQTVTIALRNDTLAEGPETFSFTLGSATAGARLGSPSTAVVTINDQDKGGVVTLGKSSYTVGESAGSLSVTLTRSGATASNALEDFVTRLAKPRTAWVMLPAGKITEATIETLAKLMQTGDVIIDGGNTFWQDDVRRGKALATVVRQTTVTDVSGNSLDVDALLDAASQQ